MEMETKKKKTIASLFENCTWEGKVVLYVMTCYLYVNWQHSVTPALSEGIHSVEPSRILPVVGYAATVVLDCHDTSLPLEIQFGRLELEGHDTTTGSINCCPHSRLIK